MPAKDGTEICLNIWCVVEEVNKFIYRIAARGYALRGSEEEKKAILKSLASTDFHVARDLPTLRKYTSKGVDEFGRELQAVTGLFVWDLDWALPDILESICREIEKDFPERLILADPAKPRKYKMRFPKNPYYLLTFMVEDDKGTLTPIMK